MKQKRIFDDMLSSSEWLLEQKGWQQPMQQAREAHFTLGNGILGSRGILEELPYDANAGTYVSGLYDSFGAQIPELVNFPNPIVFRVDISGEKLDPAAMTILEHYRALDMQNGLLVRHTIYETAHKKRVDYQFYRFVSMYQKYIGAMVVAITPKDEDMSFNVQTAVDTSVCNRGVFTEGRKRHFEVTALSSDKTSNYIEVKTLEYQHRIGYATCMDVVSKKTKRVSVDKTFVIEIKKGETVKFIKYFTIVPSFYVQKKSIKTAAKQELSRGRRLGVKRLFQASSIAWKDLWNIADIKIEDGALRQKAIRFNIYHLLIAGNADDRVSIGARTLSGEGYRGHIFWDAETFVLPFFVYTFPKIAKSMLMYRWQRLEPARKIAAAKRFKGALFPWESADTGEETTPSWFKDLAGDILKIETLDQEHHIVADIAYAVVQYVAATGDEAFMINYGLEILVETARFWRSRVTYNKKKKRYEILHAMGPDEFHKDVSNNAFTNALARFNLLAAEKWVVWAKQHYPKKLKVLSKKIDIKNDEIFDWHKVADNIYIPYSKQKKLIEMFEGYFKLKDVRIRQLDQYFMPVVPPAAQPVEDGKTKLTKQADVIMMLYMLWPNFSIDEIVKNYNYYECRTLHKSSLSPSIHSLMAARIGNLEKAMQFLTIALQADLLDVHGNAGEGFHAASGGGVWQAMVMGFGGMDARENKIIFNPVIPMTWKSLSFKVVWHGVVLEVKITKDEIEIKQKGIAKKKRVLVEVGGIQKSIDKGKTTKFKYMSIKEKV